MSDIQSISQGNYVLATQQEVSHDNSLSGNGTVDSPLGVVPGYNETVLWSGTSNTSPLTASEPLSSFEKVEIVWEHNFNNTVINHFNYTYKMPSTELFAYGGRTGATSITWFLASWSIGSDGKTLTRAQTKYIPITTTVGAPVDSVNLYPIKVVGINRKA